MEQQLETEREEIARLHAEAEAARLRAEQAHAKHAEALRLAGRRRSGSPSEAAAKARCVPPEFSRACRNRWSRGAKNWRRWLNAWPARKSWNSGLADEIAQANERANSLRQQHAALAAEKTGLESILASSLHSKLKNLADRENPARRK